MNNLNNKINELILTDPRTKTNWFMDLAGEDDSIIYNDDTGEYESNKETFEYWSNLVDEWQKADDRFYELTQNQNDDTICEQMLNDYRESHVNDLEHRPSEIMALCDKYENGEN